MAKKKTSPKKRSTKAVVQAKGKTIVAKSQKHGTVIAQAVKKAIDTLGPRDVDGSKAPEQMDQLAELLENVSTEKTALDRKTADQKTAKQAYEIAVNTLLDRLREFTHPKALPLFDSAVDNAYLKEMTDTYLEDMTDAGKVEF